MLNLLFLGFAECQLVPLQQMGGQEEKLGFFLLHPFCSKCPQHIWSSVLPFLLSC